MSYCTKYLLGLLVLAILLSCEDTKNRGNKSKSKSGKNIKIEKSAEQRRRDSLLKNLKIPSDGSETDVNIREIRKVSQEELIPFLKEYGNRNQETQAILKTPYGDITIKLYKDTPLHRANFVRLGKMGYFGTTVIHRVDSDFVIQMGNSENQSTADIRNAVGSFLIPNEYTPRHKHNRGAVSMAKFTEQNISNASSPFEFFIVIQGKNAHHLDGKHTVFGEVIAGMDVVDKIAQADTGDSEWPIENLPIEVIIQDE